MHVEGDDQEIRSYPLPEVVDSEVQWTVTDPGWTGVGTDFKSHIMSVPLGITPKERQVRNLEMARLKYSPPNPKLPPGTNPAIYAALEEVRVRKRANNDGLAVGVYPDLYDGPIDYASHMYEAQEWLFGKEVPNPHDPNERTTRFNLLYEEAAANLKKQPAAVAAGMLAMAWGSRSGALHQWDRYYYEYSAEKALEAHPQGRKIRASVQHVLQKYLSRKNPSAKAAIQAAHELSRLIAPPPPPEDGNGGDGSGGTKAQQQHQVKQSDVLKGLDQMPYSDDELINNQIQDRIESNVRANKPPTWTDEKQGNDKWAPMEVIEPPLRNRLNARMKAPGFKARDRGTVLAYPHRFLADKAVFASKVMAEGKAAVLIDTSGSMGLTLDQIAEIVRLMPGAIVGTYNGHSQEGRLHIVVRNGMWVDAEHLAPPFGGNGVDGPALRWLSKQRGPKFWVSDGYVHGRGGFSLECHIDARMICMQHRIVRLDNIEAVIEKFGK